MLPPWCGGSWTPKSPRCRELLRTWPVIEPGPTLCSKTSMRKPPRIQPRNSTPALLCCRWTPGQVDYLYERLLNAEPQEVAVIRNALVPHQDSLTSKLWSVVEQPAQGKESQRLRAAGALATYDPGGQRWETAKDKVSDDLVRVPAVYLATWMECLRPVSARLLEPLATIFRNTNREATERSLATDILADYAADQTEMLADLLMDADEKQFAVVYPKLNGHGANGDETAAGRDRQTASTQMDRPTTEPSLAETRYNPGAEDRVGSGHLR